MISSCTFRRSFNLSRSCKKAISLGTLIAIRSSSKKTLILSAPEATFVVEELVGAGVAEADCWPPDEVAEACVMEDGCRLIEAAVGPSPGLR